MLKALFLVVTAPVDLLQKLSGWKGGIALLVMTFFAGMGAAMVVGDFGTHTARILALEAWQIAHDDTVTAPRGQRLNVVSENQLGLLDRFDDLETLVSCIYWNIEPERCPAAGPRPPGRGGGP